MSDTLAVPPEIKIGERYHPGQIIVDLKHREVVTSLLEDLGFTRDQVSPDKELAKLSLALLSVEGVAQRINVLRHGARLPEEEDLWRSRKQLGLPGPPSNLDILMARLRSLARERYAGWIPVMGKNRDMEAIAGLPHIGVGEGLPKPHIGVSERLPTRLGHPLELPHRPPRKGRRLRVGVLDTGVFPNVALSGRYVTADFIPSSEPFEVWQGHATFVAGRILKRAPGVDLDIHRVLRDDDGRASSWDVAEGMASFLDSGVQILNMSLGAPTADGAAPLILERAADVLSGQLLLVAGAGNHGDVQPLVEEPTDELLATVPSSPNSPLWPAALSNVVAVGATDDEDELAPFTPRGVPWLDLVAPGVDVVSTFLIGEVQARVATAKRGRHVSTRIEHLGKFAGAARWSGTSFAAADATGEIAKLTLAEKDGTPQEALEKIQERGAGRPEVHRPPDRTEAGWEVRRPTRLPLGRRRCTRTR
jgi:hypothetical protein